MGNYWEHLLATFDPTSPLGSSYEYRYVLRELAVKAVSKDMGRALWGYGMESFYYLGLQGNLYGKPYRFLSCDSSWVELLVETGYVGLIIVAALLFSPAWEAWKEFRRYFGARPLHESVFADCNGQLLFHDVGSGHVCVGSDRLHALDYHHGIAGARPVKESLRVVPPD